MPIDGMTDGHHECSTYDTFLRFPMQGPQLQTHLEGPPTQLDNNAIMHPQKKANTQEPIETECMSTLPQNRVLGSGGHANQWGSTPRKATLA